MTKVRTCKSYLPLALAALILFVLLTPVMPVVKVEAASASSYHVWDFEDVTSAFTSTSGWITETSGPNGAGINWNARNSNNKFEVVEEDGNKVLKATVKEYNSTAPVMIVYSKHNSSSSTFAAGDKVSISFKVKLSRLYNGAEVPFVQQTGEATYTDRARHYFLSARTPAYSDVEGLGILNGNVNAGGTPGYGVSSKCLTDSINTVPVLADADGDDYAEVKLEVDTTGTTKKWKAYYYDKEQNAWVCAQHNGHDFVSQYDSDNVLYFAFLMHYDTTNKSAFANETIIYRFDDIRVSVNDGKPTASFDVSDGAELNAPIKLNTEAEIKIADLISKVSITDADSKTIGLLSAVKTETGYDLYTEEALSPNTTYTISAEQDLTYTGVWNGTTVGLASKTFTTMYPKSTFSIENNEKGVNVNTKIDVTFAAKIDATTLDKNAIIVKDASGNVVSSTVTASADGLKAQVKLTEALKPTAKYTVEVVENVIKFADDVELFGGDYLDAAKVTFYTGRVGDFSMGTDFNDYKGTNYEAIQTELRADFTDDAIISKNKLNGTDNDNAYIIKATDDGKLEMKATYYNADGYTDDSIQSVNIYFKDSKVPITGATKLSFEVEYPDSVGSNGTNSLNEPVMALISPSGGLLYAVHRSNKAGYFSFYGSNDGSGSTGIQAAAEFKDLNGNAFTWNGGTFFQSAINYRFDIVTSADGKTADCTIYANGEKIGTATAHSDNAADGIAGIKMAIWPKYYGTTVTGGKQERRIYDNIHFSTLEKSEAYLESGSYNVDVDDHIVIAFATPMNEADVDGKVTVDGTPVEGTLSDDGYFYTITTALNLNRATSYTVAIAATTDYHGNVVAAKELTFTTKANPEDIKVSDVNVSVAALEANQEVTVSTLFTNEGGTDAVATLFITLYDAQGRMLKVAGDANNTVAKNNGTATLSATFKTPETLAPGSYIKIFAWTDTDEIKPIVAESYFPAR